MEEVTENQENNAPDNNGRLTVDEVDVDFLPIVYEIIKGLEKDFHESSQKPNQSTDISHKVIELHKKLELAREQVRQLPGVEYSKEEQYTKLEGLRKQLRVKQELLLKYRNMCSFDIQKI